MGCWNGTCGITQLPIIEGEPVVAFILRQTQDYRCSDLSGGYVYNNSLFDSNALPVTAIYDDYGCIGNASTNADRVFRQYLEILSDENINPQQLVPEDIEDLFKLIERGSFKELSFMLVHKEIYDELVDNMLNRVNPYDKMEMMELIELNIHDYQNRAKQLDIKNIFLLRNDTELINNPIQNQLDKDLSFYLNELVFNNSKELELEIVSYIAFCYMMAGSRKLWIPQCGAGSQQAEYENQMLIGKYMVKKYEQVVNEYIDDGGEADSTYIAKSW